MIAILRAIFKPLPRPGDIYSFDDGWRGDPFSNSSHKVEVLEAKRGWVRYKWVDSSMFVDERLSRSSFNFYYKKDV